MNYAGRGELGELESDEGFKILKKVSRRDFFRIPRIWWQPRAVFLNKSQPLATEFRR
jgi:hypothetical protein